LFCCTSVYSPLFRMVEQSATILGKEHQLQNELHNTTKTEQVLDDYMSKLEQVLDHRENLIGKFRGLATKYRESAAAHAMV